MAQIQVNKKKRKRRNLLLTDYECLTQEEVVNTVGEIQEKLKRLFKYHIGKEDAIGPYDVFVQVYGISPESMDIFKRDYWWSIIKKILVQMRGQGDLFVVNKGSKLFVLKTVEEKNQFKQRVNLHITNLENQKKMADEWVEKEKWRNL